MTNSVAQVSYSYDSHGRVISEISAGSIHYYRYDLAGNRTRVIHGDTVGTQLPRAST